VFALKNMPLTKKDLLQIKGVVHGEVENLARIVAIGFGSIDKRFEQVDKRFDSIEIRLAHMDQRLGVVERDVAEIRKHFVYRDEFEDALARISFLEKKLGVKSGK